jgi:3-oxoacyl-[acyl-carrier protein] reductase
LASPADSANMVMFFASNHAGWIRGQAISVDGGK